MVTYVALFVLFVYAVDRWHERERRLRETTASLDRVNALILRYVPAQLADPLLAGGTPAAEGHDRRALTVCCTDIQDFAQTADEMEGEDLARLLDVYLSEMAAIAEAHGGTIHKFVGDGLIVLFGAPEARPEREQAEAAVRMALAMQRRVRQLAERWLAEGVEHPFRVRIGIHTGPAVVGSFGSPGRRDYTVVGSAMDVAARLQHACSPGAVLIGARTRALLADAFEWNTQATEDGAAFAVAAPA